MKNLLIFIGFTVLNLIMFSFPVLATLSFCLDWPFLIKWILVVITGAEIMFSIAYDCYEFDE